MVRGAPDARRTAAEEACPLPLRSLHRVFGLLVEADGKRSETDEAVWVLSEYDGVPVQSHLQHAVPDVVCVVALAESFVRHGGYIIILHGETECRYFLIGCLNSYIFSIHAHM